MIRHVGVVHQSSCVYTLQQNRVIERKHMQILEVARAIRFQEGIPLKFWGLCMQNAMYLINRIPYTALAGKSPFEMFYGRPPKQQHLRVLGNLCYATTTDRGDKFGARAEPAMHMGCSSTQKGYRLYSLTNKHFFISRDVSFMEYRSTFFLFKPQRQHA